MTWYRALGDYLCLFWAVSVLTIKVTGIVIWHCLTYIIPRFKKSLDKEIILITGAGQGLGKEIAKICARHKATLVLWDINEKSVSEVAADIRSEGGRATSYVCDVTNENEVALVANRVQKDVGDVTMLINNAGIMQNMPLEELDSRLIRKTFDVNIIAHFWTIRAFLPRMVELNKGHVVAISSLAGILGTCNLSDYSASKYAVIGMMESIAEEIRLKKKNIAFTTICPAAITTGLIHNAQTRQPLMFPLMDPAKTAQIIVTAIRKEKVILSIPGHLEFIGNFRKILPEKVTGVFMDYVDYCRLPNKSEYQNGRGPKMAEKERKMFEITISS